MDWDVSSRFTSTFPDLTGSAPLMSRTSVVVGHVEGSILAAVEGLGRFIGISKERLLPALPAIESINRSMDP